MNTLFLTLSLLLPRPDLDSQAPYFCAPKSIAEKTFTDAQVELAFVKTERPIDDVAKEFAQENGHRGYSHGVCSDGRFYIVSTPSPSPTIVQQGEDFLISDQSKYCASSTLSVINSNDPKPKTLKSTVRKVSRKNISAIALSCIPKDKINSGPELWALATPKFENLSTKRSASDLISWINYTRRTMKLPELKSLASLDETAKEAAKSKTLEHPHSLLLSKKSQLKRQKIHLLGENRAISSSFTGLANLFWNSPEHRTLLLNAKANAIGYALEEVHGQRLLVLVLAEVEP